MFNRDHVARFVAVLRFISPEESEKIKERAEAAIAEFSSSEEGLFLSGKLEEVLGNTRLACMFRDMWEGYPLVLNP